MRLGVGGWDASRGDVRSPVCEPFDPETPSALLWAAISPASPSPGTSRPRGPRRRAGAGDGRAKSARVHGPHGGAGPAHAEAAGRSARRGAWAGPGLRCGFTGALIFPVSLTATRPVTLRASSSHRRLNRIPSQTHVMSCHSSPALSLLSRSVKI